LSIWQQKEYRFDRLKAFLLSPEGKLELVKLITIPLSKNQLKRPKVTAKIITILIPVFVFYLLSFTLSWKGLLAFYILLPIIIIFCTLPAALFTTLAQHYFLFKAKAKIKKFSPTIIGVSGAYGKTTTKILIAKLLNSKLQVWVSPKSHNTPISIAKAINSTYKGQSIMIIEYAAYKIGEISYLARQFPPSMAVFTGINDQHLALFGGHRQMLKAETELFTFLTPDSFLFFNDHDLTVSNLVAKFVNLKTVRASQVKLQPRLGAQLQLIIKLNNRQIATPLIGTHYQANLEQAINVARHFELKDSEIGNALAHLSLGPEFIKTHVTKSGIRIINDDKTSNPDGFLAALDLLAAVKIGRKVVIGGGIVDLGSESHAIHTSIGKKLDSIVDLFIHTNDIAGPELSSLLKQKYLSIIGLKELKAVLVNLQAGDTVLIEGKIPVEMITYLNNL
jgi:UDP-N-acetylmuramoyl-tripeptide--D-alanyl-D-alanine ligase